jgi:hypothetical protein
MGIFLSKSIAVLVLVLNLKLSFFAKMLAFLF